MLIQYKNRNTDYFQWLPVYGYTIHNLLAFLKENTVCFVSSNHEARRYDQQESYPEKVLTPDYINSEKEKNDEEAERNKPVSVYGLSLKPKSID